MNSPIYLTEKQGRIFCAGLFEMQDEHGFPLDAAVEECRHRGWQPDIFEALCSCWLNDPRKFDSFCRQASAITSQDMASSFKRVGATTVALFPKIKQAKNPIDVVCRYWKQKAKLKRVTEKA